MVALFLLLLIVIKCYPDSEVQSGTWDYPLQSSCSGYESGFATSDISHKERIALNAFLELDDDDDSDSDWGEDEWPLDRPLPLPEWGCERPEVRFDSPEHYAEFLSKAAQHLQHSLASQPYDSLSNFVWFAKEFRQSRGNYTELQEFYRDYDPPLVQGKYTCVGLSLDLSSRLAHMENAYPGLKDATYQVSCEEQVSQVPYIPIQEPPANKCLKEHVMLCIKMRINNRPGIILLDPGYHVPEPITIMEDGQYPQSGVIQGRTTRKDIQRFYRYSFLPNNAAFVNWSVEELRNGVLHKNYSNIIHVARPFLSGTDLSERRVLVYRFRTLLGRDYDGKLLCGLYLPIRHVLKTNLTFFYESDGDIKHYKKPLSYFLENTTTEGCKERMFDVEVEEAIIAVAKGTARTARELREMLVEMAHLLRDEDFLDQLVKLDEDIENMQILG